MEMRSSSVCAFSGSGWTNGWHHDPHDAFLEVELGLLADPSQATTVADAERALETLAEHWDSQYPSLSPLWLRHWEHVITVFDYPEDIRRAIYTTHAIESLNSVIRKAINNRRIFPSDRLAWKVVSLAVEQAARKWTLPIQDWKRALNRFALLFEGRLPL